MAKEPTKSVAPSTEAPVSKEPPTLTVDELKAQIEELLSEQVALEASLDAANAAHEASQKRHAGLEIRLSEMGAAHKDAIDQLERQRDEAIAKHVNVRDRLEEITKSLKIGTVLEQDETHETVIVRRKKAARPTGRYIALVNYRCLIEDANDRDRIAKCGGLIGPETPVVMLRPGTGPDGEPYAYDLPDVVAQHGLACGALSEELR